MTGSPREIGGYLFFCMYRKFCILCAYKNIPCVSWGVGVRLECLSLRPGCPNLPLKGLGGSLIIPHNEKNAILRLLSRPSVGQKVLKSLQNFCDISKTHLLALCDSPPTAGSGLSILGKVSHKVPLLPHEEGVKVVKLLYAAK
jgi:hypothetical protein